jgi:hypothetical protein
MYEVTGLSKTFCMSSEGLSQMIGGVLIIFMTRRSRQLVLNTTELACTLQRVSRATDCTIELIDLNDALMSTIVCCFDVLL